MRIVGGKWRKRKLIDLSKKNLPLDLRPTMDRVRETIFNILAHGLQFQVQESRVLDLFCGTGALGIEALSRGAKHVCFIDKEKSSLGIVNENLLLLNVSTEANTIKSDVTKLNQNVGKDYDLIFLDPPYGKGLGELALDIALELGWIAKDAIVVWEESDAVIPPRALNLIRKKSVGKSCLNFLKRCD